MIIDSLGIIFLSYIFGCFCTILLVLVGFLAYGERVKEKILEQEQFGKSPPFTENPRLTNSTIEMINYLFQFLFQELKDTGKLRRFIDKKLRIEFNDIKQTQIGQMFLRDISVRRHIIPSSLLFILHQLDREFLYGKRMSNDHRYSTRTTRSR